MSVAQSPCLAVQKHSFSTKLFIHQGAEPMDRAASWTPPVPRLSLLSVLLPASFCGPAQIRNRLHADRSSPTSSHEPGFGGPKHFVWLTRSLPTSGRGSFNLPFAAKASRRNQSWANPASCARASGLGAGLLQSRDGDGMNPGVVVSPCDTV